MIAIPRKVYVIFYRGPGQSFPTIDMQAVHYSRDKAQRVLDAHVLRSEQARYTILQFLRDK